MKTRKREAPKNDLPSVGLAGRKPYRDKPGIRADRTWQGDVAAVPSGGQLLAQWDKRRAGHPPDFLAHDWTRQHVEFALRGAMRAVAVLPYQPGDLPQGFSVAWPDWLQDYSSPLGAARSIQPSNEQIDEMVKVIGWLSWIQSEVTRRGVAAYCAGVKWSRIRQLTADSRTPRHLRDVVYRAEFVGIAAILNDGKKISPRDIAYIPFFGL